MSVPDVMIPEEEHRYAAAPADYDAEVVASSVVKELDYQFDGKYGLRFRCVVGGYLFSSSLTAILACLSLVTLTISADILSYFFRACFGPSEWLFGFCRGSLFPSLRFAAFCASIPSLPLSSRSPQPLQ